jgi:alpha-mannosidase
MKIKVVFIGYTLNIFLFGFLQLNGQNGSSSQVEFKNAPVLFKEGNRFYQQVIASYRSETPGTIVFMAEGRNLLHAELKKDDNRFLLTFPAISKPRKTSISVKIGDKTPVKYPFTLVPPKKWEIYFVQHSHTDIGYTRPQSEILAEQMRYIDYALDYCDKTDLLPDPAKFRWTCESSWVTREYLRSRPSSQIERLKKRIAEGRVEVTGMYANMAEISDENVMTDFLQPLKVFNQLGIPVKLAMQDDVNGIAWCMPDYFKNTGVKYLIMGINKTRSILPFDKPTCFWWESPSGARLLAFRGDHYMTGNFFGMESKAIKVENMLWHLADLDEKNYPFDRISIQFSGYFTDNAPPSTAACELVKAWNNRYEYPKLRLSLASEFPEYVEKNYGDKLPIYRNAWLDWWTDGYGSTSRETAEVRKVQNQTQVDEGLFAMVSVMGGSQNKMLEEQIDHISENEIFFDEHTCGADESINRPFSENSTRQWLQKGAYAWEAVKKATLLHEEALARLQEFLKKADFPVIYVVNSMGWQRSGDVQLFVDYEVLPVSKKVRITDLSTGREIPAQVLGKRAEGAFWILEVNDIPALGAKALKIEVTNESADQEIPTRTIVETLENQFYKLVFDKSSGALQSMYDKELNQELIDAQNPFKIGQLVRETLPDRDHLNPSHSTVSDVKIERGAEGQVWESVQIGVDLKGFETGTENNPKGVDLEVRLYKNCKKIEFKYSAHKEIITDPEALFVTFPFSLPESRIVFETIGGTLTQGQQLPGSSSDWNVAQNFVSVRGKKGQIIVVSNEIPLWQFSDFNMGKFERNPKPGKTWLYSWVMNNYWFTNFRAFQEGGFSWSYQITSTRDTSNTFATKFGWGERNPFPSRTFPAGKNELKATIMETLSLSGSPNALLINTRPVFNRSRSILLHFRELDGIPAEVKVASSIPGQTIHKLTEVTAIGIPVGPPLTSIQLKPNEVKFIEVEF